MVHTTSALFSIYSSTSDTRCPNNRALLNYPLLVIVPIFVVIEAKHGGLHKRVDGPSLFLGGSSGTTCTVDKPTDSAHLEQLVLLWVGDILVDLRYQFGSHTLLDAGQHLKE